MKRLIALMCGVAGALFGAAAADAAPQPQPTLVLEPTTVAPGARFTATLEDYCSAGDTDPVSFALGGVDTEAPCQSNGLAVATLTAPSTPDEYVVLAYRDDPIATAPLLVQAAAPGLEEPLPDTGPDDMLAFTALGGGVLVAGVVLLVAARTRRPPAC